ncbi:MAG: hypothetical protein H6594_12860 [Flavobacteriales bacterium]|nr:hypothetical protein [Flavobacteriales bacterium]
MTGALRGGLELLTTTFLFSSLGCTGPPSGWHAAIAPDKGGYVVEVPAPPRMTTGMLHIAGSDVSTHAAVCSDSGLVYTTAWWDLPDAFRSLPVDSLIALSWPVVTAGLQDMHVPGAGPLGPDGPGYRSGWYLKPNGLRMGVTIRAIGRRMVLVSVAGHVQEEDGAAASRMRRCIGSLRTVPD